MEFNRKKTPLIAALGNGGREGSKGRAWAVVLVPALILAAMLTAAFYAQQPPVAQTVIVEGRVTTPDRLPIPDASVRIYPSESGLVTALVAERATDASGAFAIDLAPGRYTMTIDREGYAPAPGSPGGGGGSSLSPNVRYTLTVSPGEDIRGLEFQFVRGGVITGRILDASGNPPASGSLTVSAMRMGYRADWGIYGITTANGAGQTLRVVEDDGSYRLYGLEAGQYYVRIALRSTSNPGGFYYYPGVFESGRAVPIAVPESAEIGGIDFVLDNGREVLQPVRVRFTLDPEIADLQFPTGNLGQWWIIPRSEIGPRDVARSFVFERIAEDAVVSHGLRPGAYDLYFDGRIILRSPDGVSSSMPVWAQTSVNVSDREVVEAPAVVSAGATIPSRIVTDGSPFSGSLSEILVELPTVGMVSTFDRKRPNDDGTFILRAPERLVRVRVTRLPPGFYVESVRYGSREIRDEAIVFSDDGTPLEIRLASSAGAVEGIVRNGSDPAAHSTVVLIPPAASRTNLDLFMMTTTDQNGAFSISSVPPGEYRVLAWKYVEPGAYLVPQFLQQHEPRGERITVERGGAYRLNLNAIP